MRLQAVTKFYEQVKQEAKKVSWPSRSELVNSTVIVVLVVVIFSLLCLGIDTLIHTLIQTLLKIGK